jgi:hypothetical protein
MKKNRQSELLKQDLIEYLRSIKRCPMKPHEWKLSKLKELAISLGYKKEEREIDLLFKMDTKF